MRIAFLHPYKMADHFFVETIETAAIADLRRAGHAAEAVDYVFEDGRSEAEQLRELRTAVEGRYDLLFLERAWSDEVVRALAGLPVIGWACEDLVERGLLDVSVVAPTRSTAVAVAEALSSGRPLIDVPGLVLRQSQEVRRTSQHGGRFSVLSELRDAQFDHRARRTVSRQKANETRAVVVSNLGCAYRNVPNKTGTFEGVELPADVSTAGCTFCEVEAYERMTEEEAIVLIVRQIEAVLRDRPEVRQIAVKDDYAVRFLGKLGDALRALNLDGREIVLSARADYLLQLRPQIEEALTGRFPTPLGFYLIGFENFSDAELTRFNKGTSAAQLERIVQLMQEWSTRFPERFHVPPTGGFILFTPWTTLNDLRVNADAMRRLGFERFRGKALLSQLRLYPALPLYWLAKRDGLLVDEFERPEDSDARRRGYDADQPWRFKEPKVAQVHRALMDAAHLDDTELFEVFETALDDAAGVARGKRGRTERLKAAPNDRQGVRGPLSQQVMLNLACNQACTFCLSRGTDRTPPRARATRAIAAVRAAAQQGVRSLVITGAEPTLEWYLKDLVRLAHDLGIPEVVLETNAIALEAHGGAAALGIDRARVALNTFDPVVSDALTRDPGGHARTLAGIDALIAAGVKTELTVALVPETRGALPDIVARARERWPSLVRVVARYVPAGPPGFVPLDPRAAVDDLEAAVAASARSGLPVVSAVGAELPPCLFSEPARVKDVLRTGATLVSRDQGRSTRIAACERCALNSVCPGPLKPIAARVAELARPLQLHDGIEGMVPVSRERQRVLQEYRSTSFFVDAPGGPVQERRVVRINFHCNQACDFCFVSRELPALEHEALEREIRDVAARGATLELSGGEPTLNARLSHYLRLARELGVEKRELQTNAIKLDDAALVRELVDAGLTCAFVSLHGTSAAVSDRVTAAPGTFVRTVEGIRNLLAAGVPVRLNFVLCGYNVDELPTFPSFVKDVLCRGIEQPNIAANFSYVAASTDNVPRDTKLIPRFSEVAWAMESAHVAAIERGLEWTGFDSKCGVPACYLPRAVREKHFTNDIPPEERAQALGFTKAPACSKCELDARCHGIRTTYAELHGVDELRPVREGKVTAPAPAERTWAESVGGSPDRERVQLWAGLRQVLKKERQSLADAERTAVEARASGLVASVFTEGHRSIAFLGIEQEPVAEAMKVEPALTASFEDRKSLVHRMGALLGYPACCVTAFADTPEQSDPTHVRRLAEAQGDRQLGPESNWVPAELRAFSHFPCRPECPSTAELGGRTLRAISTVRPEYGVSLERALRSAAVIAEDGQFALLEGARKERGGFTYDRVLSHENLGLEAGVRTRPSFTKFRREVLDGLTRGDHVRATKQGLVVEKSGAPVALIPRTDGAPWLLDFTGSPKPIDVPIEPVNVAAPAELKLQVDSPCGQGCEFCSIPLDRLRAPELAPMVVAVRSSGRAGTRRLRLTGIDPLTFPGVVTLLHVAKQEGFTQVELHGPGTRLADTRFCDELLEAAPLDVQFHVPLYGADAATHDAIVGRPGAFTTVVAALDHLASRKAQVSLHTVCTRRSLVGVKSLIEFARARGLRLSFDLPFPDTEAPTDAFHQVVTTQREVADALVATSLELRELARVSGLTPCVLHAALAAVDPRRANELVSIRAELRAPPTGVRTPMVPCRHAAHCGWKSACSGTLLRAYVGRFGDGEFTPLS